MCKYLLPCCCAAILLTGCTSPYQDTQNGREYQSVMLDD